MDSPGAAGDGREVTAHDATLRVWLERAVCWRFASTIFRAPTPEGLAELRMLLPMLPDDTRDCAAPLVDIPFDTWEGEFYRVLGPGGLPSCESSFDRAALAGRGPLLAAIGGFYQAFAYDPDAQEREVPDNIAVELDFVAYLSFKGAFAADAGLQEELDVTRQAYDAFLRDHLGFWIAPFLDSLAATDSVPYRAAAAWLQHTIARLAVIPPV
ncbi:MAG: molecular chaperone TorD family protein [Acidobacteria bacterium]|nr:molecular chaperone TorD family protein [Acidobacteriota bacterium]